MHVLRSAIVAVRAELQVLRLELTTLYAAPPGEFDPMEMVRITADINRLVRRLRELESDLNA